MTVVPRWEPAGALDGPVSSPDYPARGRGGAAIVIVVLSLLVLAALAHAALVLASGEQTAAALGRERVVSRLAAEGIRDAWMADPSPFPGPGERIVLGIDTPEGRRIDLVLSGIAPALALAEAFDPRGGRLPRAAGVARFPDAAALASAARTPVQGGAVLLPPGGQRVEPEGCGGIPPGVPPEAAAGGPPSLGPWTLEELVRSTEVGAGAGDANDGTPLVRGSGWVELREDSVRALVAVEGTLVVGGTTVVLGPVLVSGDVLLEAGARVEGMLRAGGTIRGEEGAVVVGSPCLVREVIQEASGSLPWGPIRGGFPGVP